MAVIGFITLPSCMSEISHPGQRLLSLDFFRGSIMVLLALEAAGLYENLYDATGSRIWTQFFHHPWNGLRFWDLIQPGFMFIAGTAMAFSLNKQWTQGKTWNQSFVKMLKRCGWLFFWGVLDYAVRPHGLSFELWDVLTQLSFTLLVAFLIFNWSVYAQLAFSIGLLLLTEVLYRYTNIPGFDQPFTDQHNFGNYMDLVLMNKINGGGWVAINCIPTAAHTIWGALAGKLLMRETGPAMKIRTLLIAGIVGLIVGYAMDWTVTPIIKRIATSSFTIASGGWCLVALAACYWWIDVRDHRKYLKFFTIVGMNPIFIYLFFEIVGNRWFNEYVGAITNGLMEMIFVPEHLMLIITSLVIFALEWGLCYFLYSKRIFFRL
jgi:predicted acyltransferase